MRKLLGVLIVVMLGAGRAIACGWDRDTLAAEARGLPGVAQIIVGRFDRWPGAVYEQRLDRVSAQLAADPTRLDLYDDAGVASDKLARSDEAIDWMRGKRSQLDALATPDLEHEYRYHANIGTFFIHRWIRAGADRDRMDDVLAAREHIAKAIEINPQAHFGRESVQLRLIEWIIAAPDAQPPDSYTADVEIGSLLTGSLGPDGVRYWDERPGGSTQRSSATAEGLTGMIVLGGAWESFDVYWALNQALEGQGDAVLAKLARLRCRELLEAGRGSLNPNAPGPAELLARLDRLETYWSVAPPEAAAAARYFEKARSAAEARTAARDSFITARLSAGRHPDDEPWATFWDGWREPTPPKLPDGTYGKTQLTFLLSYGGRTLTLLLWALPVGAVLLGRWLWRKRRRRRAIRAQELWPPAETV